MGVLGLCSNSTSEVPGLYKQLYCASLTILHAAHTAIIANGTFSSQTPALLAILSNPKVRATCTMCWKRQNSGYLLCHVALVLQGPNGGQRTWQHIRDVSLQKQHTVTVATKHCNNSIHFQAGVYMLILINTCDARTASDGMELSTVKCNLAGYLADAEVMLAPYRSTTRLDAVVRQHCQRQQ